MRGELVPALSRVEDEDAPPRARQLQGRCKARIAPTDDDDVVHGNSLLFSAVGALHGRAGSAQRECAAVMKSRRFTARFPFFSLSAERPRERWLEDASRGGP